MTDISSFRERFNFVPARSLWVGVERECFISNGAGVPVSRATEVLKVLNDNASLIQFGSELSACQIENRTPAGPIGNLRGYLATADDILETALSSLGLRSLHTEVAPADMPLDVYPDPTGRYQEITSRMSREELLAACRIIGTHVHVGMPDHKTALCVYNRVVGETERLCKLGDESSGRRLAIYRIVTPSANPPKYASWQSFHEYADRKGFVSDPRRCWTLIRISVHGTVEFRMFGATDSLDRVCSWASICHRLCQDAMP